MILLDTNVVSEFMKKENPNSFVESWLNSVPRAGVYTSAITEAELRFGIVQLPHGKHREKLAAALEATLTEEFAGRVIPFDSPAAIAYAAIVVERKQAGRPISQLDAQIAAVARSRGSALATRNTTDFEGCGLELINPWGTKKS